MRFIPTRFHAIADYAVGIALIGLPLFFDWPAAQRAVMILSGFGIIAYSLLTDYELGASRLIPVRVHLALDAAVGVILVFSPWAFGFQQASLWPNLTFGILSLVFAATTKNFAEHRGRSETFVPQ